ncbi:MAG: hypothetical protein NZ741_11845 [Armatimonadetes bacterium]|nr:hypothetical protein [Armatimonadota bacterium]
MRWSALVIALLALGRVALGHEGEEHFWDDPEHLREMFIQMGVLAAVALGAVVYFLMGKKRRSR